MITKSFHSTLSAINRLSKDGDFTVKRGADYLDGRRVAIKKGERHFSMSFVLENADLKYYKSVTKSEIGAFELLNDEGEVFQVPVHSALLRQLKDQNNSEINSFYCEIRFDKKEDVLFKPETESFYRLVIPLKKSNKFSFYDYRFWCFDTDIKCKNAALLKVKLHGKEYHFFNIEMDDQSFIGIEGQQTEILSDFLSACWAIMSTHAFLSGCFYLDEAFYVSSNNIDFSDDLQVSYTGLRETILSDYNVFTTNGASVLAGLRESQGLKWEEESNEWLLKLEYFPVEVFEKLTELFFDHDSLLRSLFIILEANSLALELKAGAYCIAYEGICHTLKKILIIETSSVIDAKTWTNSVKPVFEGCIEKLFSEKVIDDSAKGILSRKINSLNQPTNKDALSAPFKHFGYELKPYEIKAIDNRNSFLHGGSPVNVKQEDKAFKALYFNAVTLHKLASIMLLKLAGFKGYVINYAKLHEHMTDQILEEDGFILI